MTVRKRLFWSNLLMILVLVIATVLIGLLCVGFIWLSLLRGVGLSTEHPQEFTYASMAVAESVEHKLESGRNLSSLNSLLDGNGMRLTVSSGKDTVFSYGEELEEDAVLMAAADSFGGEVIITQRGRSLFLTRHEIKGENYVICLFGGNDSGQGYYDLKTALGISVALIALTILISILITNRFLIKFVFRKIEEPLDILTDGVRQIRDGNLDYRIDYSRKDEFLPICNDFNEMALRLKQSTELVQKQQRSRKELLAGISHDIRSPLTSIQAYVEGLLDGVAKTSQDRKRYLQTIKDKAEDLDRMVSQLFLFSKMELGEYPDNPCVLRLDEMISQMTSETREEYEQKGMEIQPNLSPAVIYADPVQIRRIITNIMENSLKYKVKDKGKIIIALERMESQWKLSISDDGPGVSSEDLAHLFEVFYRSDPARRNPNQGSGLGLAIVANAVERIGGRVSAKNAAGGGLEIDMFLPVWEVNEDGEDTDH